MANVHPHEWGHSAGDGTGTRWSRAPSVLRVSTPRAAPPPLRIVLDARTLDPVDALRCGATHHDVARKDEHACATNRPGVPAANELRGVCR